MKNMIIILLLPLSAFSQEKMEGIYKFKPGLTTINIISELAQELDIKISDISDPQDFIRKTVLYKKKTQFFRLINTNTLASTKEYTYRTVSYSPTDSSHKVFYISEIKVSGVYLKDVYLFFRNNVLVSMKCDKTEELMNAMQTKYGDGTKEIKIDTVICTYKLTGNSVNEKEITITHTWINNNIEAYGVSHSYFNSKCEAQYSSYFSIQYNDLESLYITEEINAEIRLKEKLNKASKEALKEKLSDF